MRDLQIAVLGAGIIGANTILQLREQFPAAKVTLIDDRFNESTLSYNPAGIFRPGEQFGGLPTDEVKQLATYSFEYYSKLLSQPDSGISPVSGYAFSNISPSLVKNQFLENLLPVYRDATAEELRMFDVPWKYGSYYETLLTSGSSFIPWTLKKFKIAGGVTSKRRVDDFGQLKNEFDVVFNCAGMGSKTLCHDRHMVPIRGQLIKVRAPWIRKFYYNDTDTFVVPLGNGDVTLGTCKQYESANEQPNAHDTASIVSRCEKLCPRVAGAPVIAEWTGLRPYRHVLRLEVEKDDNLTIVHNYGHGGYGITMAPGTANKAVELLRQNHRRSSKL